MGLFDKLSFGLKKTKGGIFGSITKALSGSMIDDDMYEDLLDQLILADVGYETSQYLVDELERRVKKEKVKTYPELTPFINTIYKQHEDILKAARMRQDFTANVSHELKTPMTSIGGFIDGMLDGTIGEDKQEYYLRLVRIDDLTSKRIYRNESVEDLAKQLYLSPRQLSNIFHNEYHMSIKSYSYYLRIQRAAHMLECTDMPIAKISEAVGYGSSEIFAIMFKRYFGTTPSQYRKSKQQKQTACEEANYGKFSKS